MADVDRARDLLRESIARGELRSGARIAEIPFATRLHVPRSVVREALRLLAVEGLVSIYRNRGAVVATFEPEDLLEVYALRAAIGSVALHKLMLSDAKDLGPLRQRLERVGQASRAADPIAAADADLGFQDCLIGLAELPRARTVFATLTVQIKIVMRALDVQYSRPLPMIHRELEELLRAVQTGDARGAERLWRNKLERSLKTFSDHLGDAEFDPSLWRLLTRGPRAISRR
ncbi:MAG: hypothetical protein QOJ13_2789 [Gaiellales bacterium]|jgi:DNA-binding GntR family transcriptional regulator|nr:hypothetical protein [Gaiellales bacterium]